MEDTIVLYPATGVGHLVSMVELGKLIIKHHPSISITIIIITLPSQTFSTNSYISNVTATSPSINFIYLPAVDFLPPFNQSSFRDIVASFYEVPQLNNPNLHQALLNLSKTANIKALVIDFFCNSAVQISSALNIPLYYFFTSNASALCCFLYWPTINKKIPKSFKDFETKIDVPGVPSILSKDAPLVMLDRSHKVYQYFLDTAKQMVKSAGLIINSFESLEPRAIKSIIDGECTPDEPVPPIYCIGPVISTTETKQEHECLTWLKSQPSRSVVFLCFGSLGVFSASQLKEMAIALENSGVRFLWVVRNPPPDVKTNGILNPKDFSLESLLPEGFLKRTKDRGFMLTCWAPQVAILNQDSVGLFVTHCGWNSILESVCAGVPMLAWPLYAEQKMNRVFLVEEMKLALSVTQSEEGSVSAAELEKPLSEMMNSEKGETVRKRVIAMKEAAAKAVNNRGSSRLALAGLVEAFNKQGTFSSSVDSRLVS